MNNDGTLNVIGWGTVSFKWLNQLTNVRSWNTEKPHVLRKTFPHPVKIYVWVAISRHRIIGPFF